MGAMVVKPETNLIQLGLAEKPENISWQFGGRPYSRRTSKADVFVDGVSGVDRAWGNLGEEAIKCARAIESQQRHPKKILFSGGLDSEFVVAAFLQAKLSPEAVAIDFGYNHEELHFARKFCDANDVPLTVHQFQTQKFWENELQDVAEASGCISPSICALLAAVSQIDEYVILGDGEVDLFTFDGSRFYESRGERWATARWLLQTQHPGCPSFFRYSSELEAAFVFDPVIEDFQKGWAVFDSRWFSQLKYFLYHRYFGLRWRAKTLGFTDSPHWTALESQYRSHLKKLKPHSDSFCTIDFELIKKAKQNLAKFSDFNFVELAESGLPSKEIEYLRRQSKDSVHVIALDGSAR